MSNYAPVLSKVTFGIWNFVGSHISPLLSQTVRIYRQRYQTEKRFLYFRIYPLLSQFTIASHARICSIIESQTFFAVMFGLTVTKCPFKFIITGQTEHIILLQSQKGTTIQKKVPILSFSPLQKNLNLWIFSTKTWNNYFHFFLQNVWKLFKRLSYQL